MNNSMNALFFNDALISLLGIINIAKRCGLKIFNIKCFGALNQNNFMKGALIWRKVHEEIHNGKYVTFLGPYMFDI